MGNGTEDGGTQAPGWEAIDKALTPLYANQVPKHYGTLLSYELGGPDPLRGISAYKRLEPVPHWHFITYGFTELYDKESENSAVSGWGFELTMRLKTDAAAEEPPHWPLSLLQNLARYVFNSGNVFANGDYLNANGPIAQETDTLIRSMIFSHDQELPPIETPNGSVEFLQIVGITDDEELAIKQWKTLGALEIFRQYLPLLLTDIERTSLLEIDEVRKKLSAGASAEGSNTGYIFVEQLAWIEKKHPLRKPELHITLSARQIREILALLPYRLPFGLKFGLVGNEFKITIGAGDKNRYEMDGNTLHLEIQPNVLDELLSSLKPQEGIYSLRGFKGVILRVKECKAA